MAEPSSKYDATRFEVQSQLEREAEVILEEIMQRTRWQAATRDRLVEAPDKVASGKPLRKLRQGRKWWHA
ncbi:hypothetical protein [Leisingera methylohalidivorans]|uniref:Uncharacterized protein n=1 Tax=Leisingera methylohalidivorans DSM 14336 TaxID=999552 RepID=V9VYB6_9RHOB|nr:hypothetical protein [Leisingera methylohalidivorans]AHD02938.1 hypothetical protein METH_06785 [Leisingera methylohalidivorans DSM 14336]